MSERIFENVNQVVTFLADELGLSVAYNTVNAHANTSPRKLTHRRGHRGTFTLAAVLDYVWKFHADKLDRGVREQWFADKRVRVETASSSADDRASADARLKAVQAERAELKLQAERGLVTPTADVERELGARARAFRIGLESFGQDNAARISELFGADAAVARELCAVLGVEEDRAQVVMDFMLDRAESFGRWWMPRVEQFLDAYATGTWFTEQMRERWEAMEAGGGRDEQ